MSMGMEFKEVKSGVFEATNTQEPVTIFKDLFGDWEVAISGKLIEHLKGFKSFSELVREAECLVPWEFHTEWCKSGKISESEMRFL